MYIELVSSAGTHNHGIGKTGLIIQRQTILSQEEKILGIQERWDIDGWLIGDSASDIATQSTTLMNAYAAHPTSVHLRLPDASASANFVTAAQTLGGIKIVEPVSFNDTEQAAHTTFRRFRTAIEFMRPASGSNVLIVSFAESISFTGGGPMDGHLEPLTGRPIKQRWKQNTVYRATQQGRAVGFRAYPDAPDPIWPAAEIRPAREFTPENPQRHNATTLAYSHFPISWSYKFESAIQLTGNPNRWTTI